MELDIKDDEYSNYVYIDKKWANEINSDTIGIYLRLRARLGYVLMSFNTNSGYYTMKFTGNPTDLKSKFDEWKVNILDAICRESRDGMLTRNFVMNFGFKRL